MEVVGEARFRDKRCVWGNRARVSPYDVLALVSVGAFRDEYMRLVILLYP